MHKRILSIKDGRNRLAPWNDPTPGDTQQRCAEEPFAHHQSDRQPVSPHQLHVRHQGPVVREGSQRARPLSADARRI